MISDSERYELRRIFFRYEEDATRGKFRPVVVALIDRQSSRALVLKVTGHGPRKGYPGEIPLLDWREAGLEKPSTVRCSKIAVVPMDVIRESGLYGVLTLRDARRVRAALTDLGYLS